MDYMKVYLEEFDYEDVYWIHLAQNRDR
jgi:hypothetical protein